MARTLRVLLFVQSEDSAAWWTRDLRGQAYEVAAKHAATYEDMQIALFTETWDVMLCEHAPPQFNGPEILQCLHEQNPDVPVIIVSAAAEAEAIVACLKAGARDYIVRSNPERLRPALETLLHPPAAGVPPKNPEFALRESARQLKALLDTISDIVCIMDVDGTLHYHNSAVLHVLGYQPGELLGKSVYDFVHPEDAAKTRSALLQARLKPGELQMVEVRLRHKNGAWRTVEAVGREVLTEDGLHVLVVTSRDITERKTYEGRLNQSQKMELMGQLAGGVAHDFNNLLTVILGRGELLLSRLGSAQHVRRDLELIQQTAERAAKLTRQLLAFSRKQVVEFKAVDLNAVVAETENLLRRLIGEHIKLVYVKPSALGLVKADAAQMEQVLINLAVNARDAMPNGGQLTIELAQMALDKFYARSHAGVTPGPHVLLALTDTGCGMDEATQARLFEPFFTTKGVGKGTGLGLSTVYGIIAQAGGSLSVYSELGRGTTFKIYLPLVDAPAAGLSAPRAPRTLLRGHETILVVEDERDVRELAREFLEANGYQVLTAGNGAEALACCSQHPGRIHLLLTDTIMPGMGVREMVALITTARPGTKVLYMSGYTDNAIVQHGVLEPGELFLPKPFTLETLTHKVRTILNTAGELARGVETAARSS